MVKLVVSLIIAQCLTGCGLIYTVVNSEAKLDRLSLPMTKTQVVEELGRPDRVLRDDGRVLVWEYSLTGRKQWLYELSLCPLSIMLGGCIFYPFTNTFGENNREYPHHVVLVRDQLCAWGSLLVMLKKRKVCMATDTLAGEDGVADLATLGREPITTGSGPINSNLIDRYQTLAVMTFTDAVGGPGSGEKVTGIVTNLLLDLDMTIVERARLEQVFKEQVVQLQHGDDGDALRVGKLVGAKAIVLGEVQQWETRKPDNSTHVSLTLRMIDVETGLLLFGG
ncbi:MAG: CsgG/HfaB family protein, partial [Nitrospiraceae bacterium]